LKRAGLLPLNGLHRGPTAYDVACLCQDHGATIDAELEGELRRHYVALRKAAHPRFDGDAFEMAYAIVAALRATAALGITAPLTVLDPDEANARFPRLVAYLRAALAHPVLSDLAVWYDGHLPTVA
jgi:aminoglycoside/choline kinase family phosphotransferase